MRNFSFFVLAGLRKPWRLAGITLLLLTFPAIAEDVMDKNVTQYTLENGLTVILAPSATAQSVALVTQYGVGSANEAPGRSGFAHLFEHLMFEGTKAVPDFDKTISGAGGENNAFTQEDATTYYMSGPAEALPLFLRLDADRMANLANAVTQEDLDNQRAVVLNEMRQNVLDMLGGAAREQTAAAAYPEDHPYAHSPIGSIADLGAARLTDVVAFHRVHYVPSNAFVAITGRFDPAMARQLISQTFGLVPNSAEPDPAGAMEVKPTAQRLDFVDAVATPTISLRWPGARGFSKETVTNDMLAVALSVGKGSLDDRLIVQQGIAASVSAYWEDRQLGGLFTIQISAAQGVSAGALEAGVKKTLSDMQAEGIDEETLKIVRTEIETGYASVPSSPLGYGLALVESASNGDARTWRSAVDMSRSVSSADVTSAFRVFALDAALVSIITPGPRNNNYPPVIARSSGVSSAEPVASRADVAIPEIAMLDASELVLPPTGMRKLASGARLITYKIDDPAKVGIAMMIKGGDVDAPVGLSNLGMSINSRGAGDLPLAEMDAQYRENGISLYGNSGRHYSQIFASAPVPKLEALSAQLAEIALRPRFDAKEWSALLDKTVTDLESARKSPAYLATIELRKSVYPADAPEIREPDPATLKAMKSDDARALFLARVRPDETTFHVASTLPADVVAAALNKAFAGWSAKGAAGPFQDGTRPVVKETRAEIEVKGATQTAILAALPAPGEGTPEAAAFDLAVHILGGGADSRLNKVLREEKGWAYGISANASGDKDRNNSLLRVSTTVQADHTSDSIAEIRRIIAELATKPISDQELQSARRTSKAEFLNAFDSAPGTAMFAGSMSAAGYRLEDIQKLVADIDAVTLEDINRQAQIIAKSPIALSIAGDKALMK